MRRTLSTFAAAGAITLAGASVAVGPAQAAPTPLAPLTGALRVHQLRASPLGPALNQAASVAVTAFNTQPVVLTGQDFPSWSSGPEVTARVPEPPNDYGTLNSQADLPSQFQSDCYQSSPQPDNNGATDANHGDHNCFQGSQSPVRTVLTGAKPDSLRGYRWTGERFVQIPFQVDTKWVHYLTNNASGFSFYSGADEMLTYTFDLQPFSETANPPLPHNCPDQPGIGCVPASDPNQAHDAAVVCHAITKPGMTDPTPDPNPYLINTDELSFMGADAGAKAPAGQPLPAGIVSAYAVHLIDPTTGETRWVYIMESGPGREPGTWAVPARYTAANSPYVQYHPDNNADMMAPSQSSYDNYGNAPVGPACKPDGTRYGTPSIGQGFKKDANGDIVLDPKSYVRRRTLDNATVFTPRYSFRYDGRWLMDGISVSADDKGLRRHDYGPSLVDRFKSRAFQQSPGGKTPCCGYEDEQNNWGGSSMTMGVKAGPVRVIRVTWGSDSGTNVTRADVFYRNSVMHEFDVRVHPIPALDGIYSQWDMAAGAVKTYYNPYNASGVPVAGINPVLAGDISAHIGPDGISESSNDKLGRLTGPLSAGSPSSSCTSPVQQVPNGSSACVFGSFNVGDPTFSGEAQELLSWEQMSGPAGSLVEKWGVATDQPQSPGGAQALVETQPYYVDNACFDDGTGNDPGPHVAFRSPNEPRTWGFENLDGIAVAVTPAPAPADRYPGTVTRDGVTYDGTQAQPRRCWNHHVDGSPYNIPGTATFDASRPAEASDGAPDRSFGPQGDVRYLQGDVGTHGLHLIFTGDSDNAYATQPVTEIDATQGQLLLPPNEPNVGRAASQPFQTPIQGIARPYGSTVDQPGVAPSSGSGSSNPGA